MSERPLQPLNYATPPPKPPPRTWQDVVAYILMSILKATLIIAAIVGLLLLALYITCRKPLV